MPCSAASAASAASASTSLRGRQRLGSNANVGITYSYLRRSHMVFALNPPVTRLYPKILNPSGRAALMRSRTPGGSSTMRRATH